MSTKLLAVLLTLLYSLNAVMHPVLHELFCRHEGVVATLSSKHQCSCQHSHQNALEIRSLESNDFGVDSVLTQRNPRCPGDCVAYLVEDATSQANACDIGGPLFDRPCVLAEVGCKYLRSSAIHHARGPPFDS